MKVFTNYGKLSTKALKSCIIQLEDSFEWTIIHLALQQYEKYIVELYGNNIDKNPVAIKTLNTIEESIKALSPEFTISMDLFDVKNIRKDFIRITYP